MTGTHAPLGLVPGVVTAPPRDVVPGRTVRGLVAATVPPRHQSQELMVIWQPGQCVQIELCCRQGLPFDDVARWDALLSVTLFRAATCVATRSWEGSAGRLP